MGGCGDDRCRSAQKVNAVLCCTYNIDKLWSCVRFGIMKAVCGFRTILYGQVILCKKMKHYRAKHSVRLQAIQPSAAWCCANLGLDIVVATRMRMCNCTILRNMQCDHARA